MKIPNNWPRSVLVLLLFGLSVRLVLAWLPEKYLFYLVSDDAYYYFTIARNLAGRGIFSSDGITLTNGFHPLWLFLITPIFLFFKPFPWFSIHLVFSLSAAFDTAAAFLIYRTLEQLGRPKTGFWAAAFYLVNPYGLWNTMTGLETALNNFFLAGLIYFSITTTTEKLKGGWLKYGAFLGLTLLARTDNIFAVGAFLAYAAWAYRNPGTLAKMVGVASLLIVPWLCYNLITFGSLVQTSGTAYPFLNHAQFLAEHKSFLSWHLGPYLARLSFTEFALNAFHYGLWHLTLLIGLFVVYRMRYRPGGAGHLGWTLTAAVLFAVFHLFVRWSVRPWYAQAVFVLTLPAVALSFEKANRYLLAAGAAAVLFLAGWRVQAGPFRVAERSRAMLDIIKTRIPPDDRVGVFNSGYVQYFTDRKVINLDGLVNNEVLAYYRRNDGLAYLRKRNIGWVVDHWVYITKTFGPYWGPDAQRLFVLTDLVPDIAIPNNSLYVLRFIGHGPRPPYGRWIVIDSLPAPKTWVRVPLYPKF